MGKKTSVLILIAIAVITGVSIWQILALKIDYDFEAYFPQNHPETDFYLNFRKTFETDNDFIIVALENDQGIFDQRFLKEVDSLSRSLAKLPEIVQVVSPTEAVEYVRDPLFGGVFTRPWINIDNPDEYAADSMRIYSSSGMVGVLYSPDAKSVAINMKHSQGLSKEKCDTLAEVIPALVDKFHFDRSHVIGRSLGQKLYVELMVKELALFISMSLLLTAIFLFIAFRSGWGLVIPTLVVTISIIWTLGFIRLLGNDIDLMLTILPTIIFVVGMSDSVHVLSKYMQEIRAGKEKREAVRYAFKSIRLATFLTALTTSIGFVTLVASNIRPISNFGIYTSVGVMLAYGLTYSMLPAILILAPPKRLIQFAEKDDFWSRRLHNAFRWLIRSRKQVVIGTLFVLALSGLGISLIRVDNLMLEDLRDTHVLKKEFKYMENHFAGCRPFEMAMNLHKGVDVFNPDFLKQADSLDLFLAENYHVGALVSFPKLVKLANKSLNGGQDSYYSIPEDSASLALVKKFLLRKDSRKLTNLLYNDSAQTLRVTGRLADLGRVHYEKMNDSLIKTSGRLSHNFFDVQLTGTAHLIDLNNELLVENMIWDLLLSVGCIGVVMGLVYRSWKMILLTILPNLIPLLIVAGIMGFAGIPIKVSTSIIFNIAFGIAVDDTIHFLARTRTLLGEGLGIQYAVKRTFLSTGRAMIVTTFILSGGFLTLIFSDFLGTFYIGFLISLTLFIAIIAELLFTPLLVMYFYKPRKF
jgi:predicted RND superfamily exporter protein